MCQLPDFSYTVPYLAPKGRRARGATPPPAGKADPSQKWAQGRGRGQSTGADSQDGMSYEAWSDASFVMRSAAPSTAPGSPTTPEGVPLWYLSSFHAAPILMSSFLKVVEARRQEPASISQRSGL
eukprot:EG_transcript_25928